MFPSAHKMHNQKLSATKGEKGGLEYLGLLFARIEARKLETTSSKHVNVQSISYIYILAHLG